MDETVVCEYRGTPEQIRANFARGLAEAHTKGWEAINQTMIAGRRSGCAGCLGMATFGLLFLFVRPKDTLIVTYRKRS